MALNIEGASIGFDANNVQAALNNLNTQVIEEAVNKMSSSMSTLRGYVDAVWVGASAEQFKNNMEADKVMITDSLRATFDELRSELFNIVNAMAEADQELVKAREQ